MIFSELYSAYYHTVAEILRQATDHPVGKEELRNIIEKNAFEESILNIEPALTEEKWQLLKADGTSVVKKKPQMPLTMLQKRWLKAISLDPRMKLFREGQIDFERDEWKGIEPLFTPEDYDIFDQYSDGDPYSDENYIRNFRLILDAIEHQYPLRVETYNRKGKRVQTILLPQYLEYSEKDDKFRVIARDFRLGVTVNLGRIVCCEKYVGDEKGKVFRRISPRKRTVVFELKNERSALERVLLHFAHFEKQAEKLDEKHYKITVAYDKDDETELVIRILSFGPMIKVVAPAHFENLIKERLMKQKSCGL
ncbi:MAG: WYL domain-containing protein [Blautia sp.]|jgi:hypothetical protein|nr:WYL domain-containing protein [Blautia sp.]